MGMERRAPPQLVENGVTGKQVQPIGTSKRTAYDILKLILPPGFVEDGKGVLKSVLRLAEHVP